MISAEYFYSNNNIRMMSIFRDGGILGVWIDNLGGVLYFIIFILELCYFYVMPRVGFNN